MSGHLYFTLKDKNNQLGCVFFRDDGRLDWLVDGTAIVAHGKVSLYEARGALQFYVDVVQPEGVGALHLRFERLKSKLEKEGIFSPTRKRPLPRFPRCVGVVTSPTGAVIKDIVNIISRRYPLTELVLAPTPVQGNDAKEGIVSALETLNSMPEVELIILARGGGSLEELWPFNEEEVARAVFASRVPVVSGIGHDTDTSIADLAADLRAPTPSAAAELVVPDREELLRQVVSMRRSLVRATSTHLGQKREKASGLVGKLNRLLPDLPGYRQRVDEASQKALSYIQSLLDRKGEQLRLTTLHLSSLSPGRTLARGYAIVRRLSTGEVISRVEQVVRGDGIDIRVSDGSFPGVVGNASHTPRKKTPPSCQGVLPL